MCVISSCYFLVSPRRWYVALLVAITTGYLLFTFTSVSLHSRMIYNVTPIRTLSRASRYLSTYWLKLPINTRITHNLSSLTFNISLLLQSYLCISPSLLFCSIKTWIFRLVEMFSLSRFLRLFNTFSLLKQENISRF